MPPGTLAKCKEIGPTWSVARSVLAQTASSGYFIKLDLQRTSDFRILKVAGQRYVRCHGPSANTARIFSALSNILTPKRNRKNFKTLFHITNIRLSNRKSPERSNRMRIEHEPIVEVDFENPELEAALLDNSLGDGHEPPERPDLESSVCDQKYVEFQLVITFEPAEEHIYPHLSYSTDDE